MNTAVDVNATFNTMGEIKPVYLRIEDTNHELHTYKIDKVLNIKNEKYSGIDSFLYTCSVEIEDKKQEIGIKYFVNSHKWVLID